jgi:hypothetical protein
MCHLAARKLSSILLIIDGTTKWKAVAGRYCTSGFGNELPPGQNKPEYKTWPAIRETSMQHCTVYRQPDIKESNLGKGSCKHHCENRNFHSNINVLRHP